jgi:phosphopentomutase
LLHGVSPSVHGQSTLYPSRPIPNDSNFPSVLRLAAEHDMLAASIVNWQQINELFLESRIRGLKKFFGRDEAAILRILRKFLKQKDPAIVFMDLDRCDVVGHRQGFFTSFQKVCLMEMDQVLGQLVAEIDKLEGKNFVIVTTDHGGGGVNPNSHGSDHPQDRTTFWACSGPDIPRGIEMTERISILDTAVVAAAILRLPRPPSWEGKVPRTLARLLDL